MIPFFAVILPSFARLDSRSGCPYVNRGRLSAREPGMAFPTRLSWSCLQTS